MLKRYHITSQDTGHQAFIEAKDVARTEAVYAGKYYSDFYPPYLMADGRWCVQNSMCMVYFKVKEMV